jgi:hypothetical protein
LAEASSLVSSDLRKSKFCPFKSAMRISGLVLLVLLVLWYFWYFWYSGFLNFWYFVKLGFHFPENLATEKVRSKCQNDPWGRAQLSMVLDC